jgi:hypothetical protein
MSARALRLWLIAILLVAAVVTTVGNRTGSALVGWLGFAVFLCGIAVYARWRRAALAERRARVFDRKAKTGEAGTRADR